jgi:hypothetical protein
MDKSKPSDQRINLNSTFLKSTYLLAARHIEQISSWQSAASTLWIPTVCRQWRQWRQWRHRNDGN